MRPSVVASKTATSPSGQGGDANGDLLAGGRVPLSGGAVVAGGGEAGAPGTRPRIGR